MPKFYFHLWNSNMVSIDRRPKRFFEVTDMPAPRDGAVCYPKGHALMTFDASE